MARMSTRRKLTEEEKKKAFEALGMPWKTFIQPSRIYTDPNGQKLLSDIKPGTTIVSKDGMDTFYESEFLRILIRPVQDVGYVVVYSFPKLEEDPITEPFKKFDDAVDRANSLLRNHLTIMDGEA